MTKMAKIVTKTQRNSSIELLRIIAMVMIISSHFATHGGFTFNTSTITLPRLWWYFIEMGGNLGNNIYMLISGYYLIRENNEKTFVLKKILKFWGQVFFYSSLIYFVFFLAGFYSFDVVSFIKNIFPITFSSWWFASTYFVLYLIHPFLNLFLLKIDKENYKKLLVLFIFLWCIIPTFTKRTFQCNNFIWFITLYCIAGYIRLYGLNTAISSKHYLLFFFIFSGLRYLSSIVLIAVGTKISFVANYSLFFYGMQSVLTLFSALSLFMFFVKKDINYVKCINIMSSATFGVYLIHDNDNVRTFLWKNVFVNAQYQDSVFLIPYSIITVTLVYFSCTAIDLVRKNFIEKYYIKFIDRYAEKILLLFEPFVVFIKEIIFGK